ncbi:hypothetical protein TanjilG_06246 [Lupinus angustifolius]|uniref:RING-type E3 ubiquitin transferase n=1 Tax=Lupinus angustifolius TaxID=3871 RepID=A0A394DFA1_LUPAN|nr:hypothetical protein TanjilG_06246 [Lupinus angustifolius]
MFEGEPDQNWNHMHADQHHLLPGMPNTSENGSLIYPVENMSTDSVSSPSRWNSTTRSNGYATSSLNVEVPPHQWVASDTSNNHFMHSSSAGAFFAVSENYAHHPSSSNYDGQAFHINDGFIDLTRGSRRGPRKRKSPEIPPVFERGSTSRYFNAGSSTDLPISSELRPEKPNIDYQYMPWDHATLTPTFRGGGLSIRGESSLRNVRSRSALDLESNIARTHLSSNHSHNYSASLPVEHSSMVDPSGQTSSVLARDWSQRSISPARGRPLLADTSAFSLEASHFLVGSGATASNASVDVGAYHQEQPSTSRNPTAPQSFHNNPTQAVRGVRSHYSQRSTPTFRASSGLCLGYVTPSDDGLPVVAENYTSRHPRPRSSTISRWRNNDRNGRSRISSDRYQSLVDEELLNLGERIGHVSTGLCEDLLSKCLIESIYCSSEQSQDEEACVICLEEYNNMDDVGTLKTCGHDYHVSCIKKWLSMNKLCPICKDSALSEDKKDNN